MSENLWKRDDQTQGKHLVLQHYLTGWFPILGRSNDRLLFVDGFAGPGEYADGEQGSPLIALECVDVIRLLADLMVSRLPVSSLRKTTRGRIT